MIKKTVYETEDGKTFDDLEDARQNEVKLDLEKKYDFDSIYDGIGDQVDFTNIANWMKCNPALVKDMVKFYCDEPAEPDCEMVDDSGNHIDFEDAMAPIG